MTDLIWGPFHRAIFDEIKTGKGHILINAVAGAGKTTTILEALKYVSRSKQVAFVAFGRDIAAELKKRAPWHVEVKTLNALGMKLIAWRVGAVTFDEKKGEKIARQISGLKAVEDRLAEIETLKNGPFDSEDEAEALLNEREALEAKTNALRGRVFALAHAVGLAKAHLAANVADVEAVMDRHDITPPTHDDEDDDLTWREGRAEFIDQVLRCMALAKKRRTVVDYDDQIWLPVVHGFTGLNLDVLFVDESQDMNLAQIEFVLRCVIRKPNGRIVAVGDPHQSAYSFRGAAADAFGVLRDRLLEDKYGVRELPLSVSYRCPTSIVALAQGYVPEIEAAPNAPVGRVEVVDIDGHAALDYVIGRADTGDMIVSRYNAPLMPLCLAFLRLRKPARILGRDVGGRLTSIIRRAHKGGDLVGVLKRIDAWGAKETARLERADKDASHVLDQVACIHAVIDGERAQGATTPDSVCDKIERLFVEGRHKDGITLATTHKAKGLERDKVFVLKATYLREGKRIDAREEANLYYIAITRARKHLVLVGNRRQRSAEQLGLSVLGL